MFDQDEQDLSQIVEAGLQAVLSGSATLEEVLARHPEHAERIRPELEAALWLYARRQEVGTRPGFISASRKRVLNKIKAESGSRSTKHAFLGIAWPQRISFQWAAVAVLLVLLFGGTGGVVSYAQGSLPGDDLYAVKRASESVAYTVTLNSDSRIHLSAQFATRRVQEVKALMQEGRYAQVAPTLKEFRKHVSQAVALLQEANERKDPDTLALATQLKQDLSEQVLELAVLKADAPAMLLGALDDAETMLLASIEVTDIVVLEATPDALLTGTPTLTITPTLTLTPQLSQTPSPFDLMATEHPSLFTDDTLIPVPESETDSASPVSTPSIIDSSEEDPKIWNTHRPADPGSAADEVRQNEDKDDKDDKEDKEDKDK